MPPVRQRPNRLSRSIYPISFLSQFNSPSNIHAVSHSLANEPHPPLVLGPVGNRIIPSGPFQPVPLLKLIFLPLHHLYHQHHPPPLRHLPYAKTIVSDMPCLLLEVKSLCNIWHPKTDVVSHYGDRCSSRRLSFLSYKQAVQQYNTRNTQLPSPISPSINPLQFSLLSYNLICCNPLPEVLHQSRTSGSVLQTALYSLTLVHSISNPLTRNTDLIGSATFRTKPWPCFVVWSLGETM